MRAEGTDGKVKQIHKEGDVHVNWTIGKTMFIP